MATICPASLIQAMYVECERASDYKKEQFLKKPSYLLGKIKVGEPVDRSQNSDTILKSRAKQAARGYKSIDHTRPTEIVSGLMPGRANCDDRTAMWEVGINDLESENGCDQETCILDFAHGFRRRGFTDRLLQYKTNPICITDLEVYNPAQIQEYLKDVRDDFVQWGIEQKENDLFSLAILHSEANGSVMSASGLHLSSGGWSGEPNHPITIHYLRMYRNYLISQGALKQGEKLQVRISSQEWIDAVDFDQRERSGPHVVVELKRFDDDIGRMRDMEYHDYDGIRAWISEDLPRGFFKQVSKTPSGKPIKRWVSIEPTLNIPSPDGAGLIEGPNLDWFKNEIICDGILYPVCTVIMVLHDEQFTIHPMRQPAKMTGASASIPYDGSVHLADGATLGPCNVWNDSLALLSRDRYRFNIRRPAWGGFIVSRVGGTCGYVRPVCKPICEDIPEGFATGPEFETCSERCAPECAPATVPMISTYNLDPCGDITTVYAGTTRRVRLAVCRSAASTDAGTVAYTIADPALAGLVYNDVSATPGSLSWLIGEFTCKYIELDIIAGATDPNDDVVLTVTLNSATGGLLSTCSVATLTVETCTPAMAGAPCVGPGCTGNPVPVAPVAPTP